MQMLNGGRLYIEASSPHTHVTEILKFIVAVATYGVIRLEFEKQVRIYCMEILYQMFIGG